ncbi:MAG: NADH-quinone oxidoreductase subunit NuoE [Christensenellales bacterium]
MAERSQKELFDVLDQYIAEVKDTPGPLMRVMQKAQDVFGYLPIEVQNHIAEALKVPVTEVYGIATFYSQFTLYPKGKHTISICLGTACYVKGAQAVFDELKKQLGIEEGATTEDGKFTLLSTRCLGCCGLAPVVTVDEDVYGRLTPKEVAAMLAKY